jgi:hypothetical protein
MANQSHVTSSTSFLKDINLKTVAIDCATGAGNYAITGLAADDVIAFAFGMHFSGSTVTSTGADLATATVAGAGSVTLATVTSGGIAVVGYLDVSE